MKALAVALLLSLSLLGAERALAGDLPLPGPVPPNSYYPANSYYPPSTPPINWGGVYIGLNGGYGLGTSDWGDQSGNTGSFNVNGGLFGGTLGVNYAGFGDWVLLGFEGDFDWSGASGNASCTPLGSAAFPEPAGARCQTAIDWLATFRLRAGYTWSHFLFYVTAGGAVGDFRLKDAVTTLNPTAPLGWTAGLGMEYAFTDAISAKIEYLYVDLGRQSCPAGVICSFDNNATSDGSIGFKENLIRAGVNYKFSW
jgi:outer membrane immunogenic protein